MGAKNKYTLLIIMMLTFATLGGCGKSKSSQPEQPPTETAEEKTKKYIAEKSEEAGTPEHEIIGDWKIFYHDGAVPTVYTIREDGQIKFFASYGNFDVDISKGKCMKWIDENQFILYADKEMTNELSLWKRVVVSAVQEGKAIAETPSTSENTNNVNESTNSAVPAFEKVSFSDDELREVNIFLSNFSEAGFDNYDRANPNRTDLLTFCVMHAEMNNGEDEQPYITEEAVNKTLKRYLGIENFKHGLEGQMPPINLAGGTLLWLYYENARYYFAFNSNFQAYISTEVTSASYDKKTGEYLFDMDILAVSTISDDMVFDDVSEIYHPGFLNKYRKYLDIDATGTAKAKKVTENGKTRYILLSVDTKRV